jgi:hypothetical protein
MSDKVSAFVDLYRYDIETRWSMGQQKRPHSVYVIKEGETISETHDLTQRHAESLFRELAHQYPAADGYEVCIYLGADREMAASTWNREDD